MTKTRKRVLIGIGIALVAVVLVQGIVLSIPSKTVDFSGEVTEITADGDTYTLRIAEGSIATYVVVADARTKVYDGDSRVSLDAIQIGDHVSGNYRLWTKNHTAKTIKIR